ncbi:MAG: hypothetical protein II064_07975 [Bacteroidales bacterium]|nr:hypothetical protein [Bacteroidales bacterium]
MEIKGKVHCLFEQSGTFKGEFIKLGIPAEDYDIQNNFGQTDHVIDLFAEIENAYRGGQSVFDSMTCDDLIMAFFPCIYFSALSQMAINFGYKNYKRYSVREKAEAVLERSRNRERYFALAVEMLAVAMERGLRLIMENPWSEQTFLKANFILAPSLVDNNRAKRGDYYAKPTAYWFINAEPTDGDTSQPRKPVRVLDQKKNPVAGMCSEDRSAIHPDYARNFICDFILGRAQNNTQLKLF